MRRDLFKRMVASVAAVTVMVTGTPQMGLVYADSTAESTYALSKSNVLNASELEPIKEALADSVTFGDFTLTKGIIIDSSVKTGEDNLAFTQRIKLGGTGSVDQRSICFDTTGPATVTIYCLSGSSTVDRSLTIYNAKNNEAVGTVDALGKEEQISKRTVTVNEAGSYYVASPASSVNVYYMAVEQETKKVLVHSILDPSKEEVKNLTEDTQINGYTIKANSQKAVDITAMAKEGQNNMSFVNALKLNGTGEEAVRSIHFKTEGEATVTVYALSGGAERNFALYKAGGEMVKTFPVAANTSTTMDAVTIDITDAGEYYLASPSGGVNVFYVDVAEMKEGEAAPERPSWADVAAPELVSAAVNEENASEVLVSWKMDISDAGADRVEAELIDADGKLNVKATQRTEGTEGILAVKPTKSGSFRVVVKAYRAGEEEVKTSSELEVKDYVRPLDSFKITKALTGKNSTLRLAWDAVSEADTYNVSYKEAGTDKEVEVAKDITATEYEITSGLTALTEYEITVTAVRGNDTKTATIKKVVQAEAERWLSGFVGSGSKGSEVKVNNDGTITMSNTNGKIAESEDQFSYYYTEIDPKTENFTLTATFRVDNAGSKDNQSGFGIMAVDTLDTVNDARYMNSVSSMVTRFTVDAAAKEYLYGLPGLRTITGYTEAPTNSQAGKRVMDATQTFDSNYNLDKVAGTANPNQPRFFDGETYTFTLRRSNTGYHAMFTDQNGKEYEELISYGETLLKQDADKLYVGFVVGRKITTTVTDYKFTTVKPEDDDAALERPTTYFDPTFSSDTTRTTSSTSYKPVFTSNVAGTIEVANEAGEVLAKDVSVLAKERKEVPVTLAEGTNKLKVTFTPAAKENQVLADYTDLSSYAPITYDMSVSVKAYGTEENAIYVSPQGKADGEGTKKSPLDVYTAVSYVQPGQEIILLGGEYDLSKGITIPRGINGTADKRITLMSDPNERAVLNFADSTSGGISLCADYWHIYDLEIKNTKSGKPMHVQGSNNIVEKLTIHDNADTGLQINGPAEEGYAMWPSNNLIQSVEVYNSCDPLANDADGFAAKISVGDGNVFRYCISHHNIDDGWDLYAKSTSGSIGVVTIDSCVAYSNGKLTSDADTGLIGEGNGFKLGGESMPGAHILKNCVSFNNLAKGVTSNSGPDPQVYNVTSFANKGENIALYTNNASSTNYKVEGFLSYKPEKIDYIEVKNQAAITSTTNYLNGVNTAGDAVKDTWFVSTKAVVPTYNQDGTINLGDFLKLTEEAPAETGARFTANQTPTVIIPGTEIGTQPIATQTPTVKPTETPATEAPTLKPTETPATEAPTLKPTETPATEAPTVKPTQTPATPKPTVKPTQKPATPKPTVKPVVRVSISKATASKISNQVYTGKAIKPSVTLKYNKKTLKKGTDYTVSYKNNVKTGKATVIINGKGKYTGTKTVSFNIVPKKVTGLKVSSKKAKTATVTYKKATGASGYQILYKTSKNGKYKVAGYTSKTTATIKKCKSKKTIYVKVRAYKTINGKKVYGGYSTVKSVKVK